MRLLSDLDGGLILPSDNSFDFHAVILIVLATVINIKDCNRLVKSITKSFIMLDTMIEIENNRFTNIWIPFLRSCSQH